MIPGNINTALISGAEGGYAISRSLRFNSSDSAYLSRTPASAGNRKTWTWAGWVKRSAVGSGDQMLFSTGTSGATTSAVVFLRNDSLFYSTAAADVLATTAVFRDPSAWFHILIAFDSTQTSAVLRVRFYINGLEVTQFSTDARASQVSQNTDYGFNLNQAHEIGRFTLDSSRYFNGYLADIHFIDGQALDPTSFGEFDTNGIWQPQAFAGSYGTNGFHLDFDDNSTAAALGADSSGAGNTWTVNNLSVTAGAGNDSLVDVPTNGSETDTGAGGEVRGNYCTLNPLTSSGGTYGEGNLVFVGPVDYRRSNGTIAVSTGKWYWEATLGNGPYTPRSSTSQWNAFGFGLSSVSHSTVSSSQVNDAVVLSDNGYYKNFSGSNTDGGTAFSSGDVLSCAVDLDANTFTFRWNNTQIATGTIGGTAGRELAPIIISYSGNYGAMNCNFGQRPFAYTAPSGFKALCTANLPAPVVTKPSTVMDVKLYTGNGSTQTISGLNMSPDLVWIKCRSVGSTYHSLYDIVRGAYKRLSSNVTDAEYTYSTTGLTAFSTSSFTVADDTAGSDNVNGAVGGTYSGAAQYAAWCWDAGSSTVTNTQGSISSQVRANASAGFSIVTYTGTGSAATVGHGLGVAPSLVLVKIRSQTGNWQGYHASLGKNYTIKLNTTDAQENIADYWGAGGVTSSVVGLIGGGYTTNINGATHVAYCFAPVAGYSSFGSYTGNGSSDGPFVYTGFRPRYVLQKKTSDVSAWSIRDAARDPYNAANTRLWTNFSSAESSADAIDILSNGFKVRNTDTDWNASGATYIYAAFAESPFQYARAR
jgi:hypothetical protein